MSSGVWPRAAAIDNELCQSASRRARHAALVGSAPRMSVPMPISSTMRFLVIAIPSVIVLRCEKLFAACHRQPRHLRAALRLERFDHVAVLKRDIDVVDAADQPILA